MREVLQAAARARRVGAAVLDLALGLLDRRAAAGTVRGHLPGRVSLRTLGHQRAHDLGDHVARPLHDHGIALADVLAVDVLLVVQRRQRHRHPTDHHRLEHRKRVERPGAAHVDDDRTQRRGRRGRRKLVGDRPARVAADHTQPCLLRERGDLHHRPVDVVVELGPAGLPRAAGRDHIVHVGVGRDLVGHAQAVRAHPLERLDVGFELEPVVIADGVDPHPQGPPRRDRRILLAQRAGSRVAGIHEGGQAGRRPLLVDPREALQRQVHLTAHLDHRGRLLAGAEPQPQRNARDRPQVGGYILSHLAVATRRAADKHAALVRERDRQTVDLGLDHPLGLGAVERALRALHPREQLVLVARICERQHRLAVGDLGEVARRDCADPLGG